MTQHYHVKLDGESIPLAFTSELDAELFCGQGARGLAQMIEASGAIATIAFGVVAGGGSVRSVARGDDIIHVVTRTICTEEECYAP